MADSKLYSDSGPIKLSTGQTGERITPKEAEKTSEGMTVANQDLPVKVEDAQRTAEIPRVTQAGPVSIPAWNRPSVTQSTGMGKAKDNVEHNISTSWSPSRVAPVVDERSYVHPKGLVIGNVIIRPGVFIAPFAAVRGDEEESIYIGENSAILEGAIINALPTQRGSEKLTQRLIKVDNREYPVYVATKVTICQGVKIHGPAYIGSNTYIGMASLVFWAKIGSGCVIEPGALIINVEIPDGRFVPAGLTVTSQKIVGTLPLITDKYRFARINEEMLVENGEIVEGYLRSY